MTAATKALPKLMLKPGRDKSVNNYHPWVFSGAIQEAPRGAETGSIVAVANAFGVVIAHAFYDAESQIVARIFNFNTEQQVFDQSFWNHKIQQAYNLRQARVSNAQTNAYRLIHAEGDSLPGVIADVYADTVVLQLRTAGAEKIVHELTQAIIAVGFPKVYLKNKHYDGETPNGALPDGWLTGEGNTQIEVLENGLKFQVDIESGQKTGFFLDQRDNRELLGKLSKDKTVLNAFAYSGGFSVYALANGAKEVHSIDISKSAIVLAEANVALNFPDTKKHESLAQDCFKYLKNMETEYDIIILDPPAFAKSMRARDRAARGYKEINLTALSKIKPGGILATFSCSQVVDRDLFRKIIFSAAADAGRNVRILYQLTQPEDHPINIYHPEGEYLKGLILYVE